MKKGEISRQVVVAPPNFETAEFHIRGVAPLVIHRFTEKVKRELTEKMETGKPASSRRKREPQSTDDLYNAARYISKEGWDGFHAGAVRAAMISACRLVGYKMTLAKLAVHVEADGWDAKEPQVPLIRIYGKPIKQTDVARVSNVNRDPYITVRPAYLDWEAKLRIRWDADQFTAKDIANLLMRVGLQVGLCEGRPDSKRSCGMGWGLFELVNGKERK